MEIDGGPAVAHLDRLIRELRVETLPYEAAGRFAGRGLLSALPLDDAAPLEATNPVRPDSRVAADPTAVAARHEAQVRRVMAGDLVLVLVLGGVHDLSPAIGRLKASRWKRSRTGGFAN